jgi:uncharacterized damage-inducible protein DinB
MTFPLPQPEQPGMSVLAAIFQHNAWASLKLLDFCKALSDEQLDATTPGTYGTIRDTLLHLIYAEVSYVERVNGKRPPKLAPEDEEQFPGFKPLADAVRWTGDEMLQLALSAFTDTLVIERFPHGTEQYKLTDLMVQAISHSIEHRTQISTIITHLGMEPPDMSGWQWMDERGEIKVTQFAAAQ